MNKKLTSLACCMAFLFVLSLRTQGQSSESPAESKPQIYRLKLMPFADEEYKQPLVVFNGTAFKSLSSPALRGWLENYPKDTIIEWVPLCVSFEGKPYGPTDEEVREFGDFCKSKGINFIVMRGA